MSFKDRVKKYANVNLNEMAVPKTKRDGVLKDMRTEIDKGNFDKAAEIFKRNGGANLTKDFKKEGNPEIGLDASEQSKLKSALKGLKDVSSNSEVATEKPADSDYLKSLKTTLETIKDRYKAQLSVLKGNPIDMSSPAKITRKDSREGVQDSKKYREDKIAELKKDLKILSTKIDGFNEISDEAFQKMSIEEKREYMNKKKEARELKEQMRETLEKYDKGVHERKKQRGRPDSAIERAGEHGRAGVKNLNEYEKIIGKYNQAKPITKEDVKNLQSILKDWLPLYRDRTEPDYDIKQAGIINRVLKKIDESLKNNDFEDNSLDPDTAEDIFDELNNLDTGE
jgi:hypothetical protein